MMFEHAHLDHASHDDLVEKIAERLGHVNDCPHDPSGSSGFRFGQRKTE